MAEGWANHLGNGQVQAFSAGTHPYGEIAGETYDVMHEKGLPLEAHCSKGLGDVPVGEMDVVVKMGSEVAFSLPEGFQGRVEDWNIPDPFGRGVVVFRNVRDMIERQVLGLLAEIVKPRPSGP